MNRQPRIPVWAILLIGLMVMAVIVAYIIGYELTGHIIAGVAVAFMLIANAWLHRAERRWIAQLELEKQKERQ